MAKSLKSLLHADKIHIAEPERLTLCGRPSTPVKFVSAAEAAIIRDGSAGRICRKCNAIDLERNGRDSGE
jgi:hypothetical protein